MTTPSTSKTTFKIFYFFCYLAAVKLCQTNKTLSNPAADLLNRVCSCLHTYAMLRLICGCWYGRKGTLLSNRSIDRQAQHPSRVLINWRQIVLMSSCLFGFFPLPIGPRENEIEIGQVYPTSNFEIWHFSGTFPHLPLFYLEQPLSVNSYLGGSGGVGGVGGISHLMVALSKITASARKVQDFKITGRVRICLLNFSIRNHVTSFHISSTVDVLG